MHNGYRWLLAWQDVESLSKQASGISVKDFLIKLTEVGGLILNVGSTVP